MGAWLGFGAVIGLGAVTVLYLVAEWQRNWQDIHGGPWGVYLKFWGMSTPWLLSLAVLPAIFYKQIDYLYGPVGSGRNGAENNPDHEVEIRQDATILVEMSRR